ncbi:unnamed protein product [Penicillium salamii]|nr:unnamed protein product [Penicillium salamii]
MKDGMGGQGSVYMSKKSWKMCGQCADFVLDRNLKTRSSMAKLEEYARAWRECEPRTMVSCEGTIEGALDRARIIGRTSELAHVLITGSLHLVSGALGILETKGN